MEENKKELTPDPEELEVKSLLLKISEIAKRKKIPILCQAKLNTLDTKIIIGTGNPLSIMELIIESMKKDPVIKKLFIGAVAMHMIDQDDKSVPDI